MKECCSGKPTSPPPAASSSNKLEFGLSNSTSIGESRKARPRGNKNCRPTKVPLQRTVITSGWWQGEPKNALCCQNDSVGQAQPISCIDGSAFQSEGLPDELNLSEDIP